MFTVRTLDPRCVFANALLVPTFVLIAGAALLLIHDSLPAVLRTLPCVSSERAREVGPDSTSETVGRLTVYRVRGDWQAWASRFRHTTRAYRDVEELGPNGCLYPICGADIRWCWNLGTSLALVKDFAPLRQRLTHPLSALGALKGSKAVGVHTVIYFDGEIRDRPK